VILMIQFARSVQEVTSLVVVWQSRQSWQHTHADNICPCGQKLSKLKCCPSKRPDTVLCCLPDFEQSTSPIHSANQPCLSSPLLMTHTCRYHVASLASEFHGNNVMLPAIPSILISQRDVSSHNDTRDTSLSEVRIFRHDPLFTMVAQP
jgi:hypothetical protein